ncbi:hypothetical protein EK904_007384 [Melospiza melodia maxima]|nr:hypothetical protein EK904_007384 [Melospiza melodia maxima]
MQYCHLINAENYPDFALSKYFSANLWCLCRYNRSCNSVENCNSIAKRLQKLSNFSVKLPREYKTPRGRFPPAAVYHSGCSQDGLKVWWKLHPLNFSSSFQPSRMTSRNADSSAPQALSGTVHAATAIRHLHSALTLL